MGIEILDSIELLEVLRVQESIPSFWRDRFFKRVINFQTDKIAFDKVSEDYRRLAPLVAPNVQGRVLKKQGYSAVSYAPAYVKPKDIVDPSLDLERQAGEALVTGTFSLQQRYDAVVGQLLAKQRTMVENRLEWMAAMAMIDGAVTLEDRDYPLVTIDFGRDATLSDTLLTTARWSQGSATPLADLTDMRRRVQSLSGAVVRDYIFGMDAWEMFRTSQAVEDLLSTLVRGSETTLTAMYDGFPGVEYVGTLQGAGGAGAVRCWVYSGKYIDENDVEHDILDSEAVVGVSDQVGGVQCFGAIRDKRAGFQALSMFPKMWDEEDPSVTWLMTQSAPLMVPKQPNATFKLQTNG